LVKNISSQAFTRCRDFAGQRFGGLTLRHQSGRTRSQTVLGGPLRGASIHFTHPHIAVRRRGAFSDGRWHLSPFQRCQPPKHNDEGPMRRLQGALRRQHRWKAPRTTTKFRLFRRAAGEAKNWKSSTTGASQRLSRLRCRRLRPAGRVSRSTHRRGWRSQESLARTKRTKVLGAEHRGMIETRSK
jgi:hypothetical protein